MKNNKFLKIITFLLVCIVSLGFLCEPVSAFYYREEDEYNCEVISYINNREEINKDESLDLEIKIKSNSVINYIEVIYDDEEYKTVSFRLNPETEASDDGTYILKSDKNTKLAKYAASGKYDFQKIIVHYEDGMDTLFFHYFDNYGNAFNFNYNNPEEDIVDPVIEGIYVNNSVALLGYTVKIEVKATDNLSGFYQEEGTENSALIELSYRDNYDYYNSILLYDKDTDSFKGEFEIPLDATTGVYTIDSITILDIAGNKRTYETTSDENVRLLSQGTILVKEDLNEEVSPIIITDIQQGEVFVDSVIPYIFVDQGSIEMTLNGKEYNYEEISIPGRYSLCMKATGLDGSISINNVEFKVIVVIYNNTEVEDIINFIENSISNKVELFIETEDMTIYKDIFEAIKGTDKEVSFEQEDGTVWTFNGKDINNENIGDVVLTISDIATNESVQDIITELDESARIIHFNHHGNLPGKASVKIFLGKDCELYGKELTFYYFDNETEKVEKIQGPITIDDEGFITVEITHCSDYFLSVDDSLDNTKEDIVISLEKDSYELVVGDTAKINATVSPSTEEIVFSSNDNEVASVSEDGTITALKEGIAVITVTVDNEVKEVNVTVKAKVKETILPDDNDDEVVTLDNKKEVEGNKIEKGNK